MTAELLGKSHPAQQLRVPRIGSERIDPRVHLQEHHLGRPFAVPLVQVAERAVLLSQRRAVNAET